MTLLHLRGSNQPAPADVPPTEPGWIPYHGYFGLATAAIGLAVIGTALVTVAGTFDTAWELGRSTPVTEAIALPRLAAIAVSGALLLWALRAGLLRRHLLAHRYRSASPILLLLIAVLLGQALMIPFTKEIDASLLGGQMSPLAAIVFLTGPQIAMLAVTFAFVIWPKALAGSSLFRPRRVVANVGYGLLLGVGGWFATVILVAVVAVTLGRPMQVTGGLVEGEWITHPLLIFGLLVVLTPVAEELMFRGVLFNAWEREYGTRTAIIGSTVIFGAVHVGMPGPDLLDQLVLALPLVATVTLFGWMLALAYESGRSLLRTSIAHAAFNAVGFFVAGGVLT